MDLLLYLIKQSSGACLNDKTNKLITEYINDKAHAVRKEGIKLLVKIHCEVGSGWVEKNLMPKIFPLAKAKSYIQR